MIKLPQAYFLISDNFLITTKIKKDNFSIIFVNNSQQLVFQTDDKIRFNEFIKTLRNFLKSFDEAIPKLNSGILFRHQWLEEEKYHSSNYAKYVTKICSNEELTTTEVGLVTQQLPNNQHCSIVFCIDDVSLEFNNNYNERFLNEDRVSLFIDDLRKIICSLTLVTNFITHNYDSHFSDHAKEADGYNVSFAISMKNLKS